MTEYIAKAGGEAGTTMGRPPRPVSQAVDVYFSADVETDGPIPGPYSMLSFALVCAGRFDGRRFERPANYDDVFEVDLRPISQEFDQEALDVNGIDRSALLTSGLEPAVAMTRAARWIQERSVGGSPVLVAYPLSFDWAWLYWYFTRFTGTSPFQHSRCFDVKTAIAIKTRRPICASGRASIPAAYRSDRPHTHRATEDAIEQAEIFANVFEDTRR